MNPFQEQRIRGRGGFWIIVKNPIMFLRPVERTRGNMPTPTAGLTYPLSLGQISLAVAQVLFRSLALSDVYNNRREKRRRVSFCRDQGTADLCPNHVAVVAPVAFLVSVVPSPPLGGLCQNHFGGRTVFFIGHFHNGEPVELILRVAENFLQS